MEKLIWKAIDLGSSSGMLKSIDGAGYKNIMLGRITFSVVVPLRNLTRNAGPVFHL